MYLPRSSTRLFYGKKINSRFNAQFLWFLVPAGLANALPPVAAKLFPNWDRPLDFNKRWRGQKIFGAHKTIKGTIVGVIAACLIRQVQRYLVTQHDSLQELSIDQNVVINERK